MSARGGALTRLIVRLGAAALAVACGQAPRAETETSMPTALPSGSHESQIAVAAGATFSITLDANPSTGYQWALLEPLDAAVIELIGSEYQRPASTMPGAGGAEIWTFRAIRGGTARITLRYGRPWERDAPPLETRAYRVTVQ